MTGKFFSGWAQCSAKRGQKVASAMYILPSACKTIRTCVRHSLCLTARKCFEVKKRLSLWPLCLGDTLTFSCPLLHSRGHAVAKRTWDTVGNAVAKRTWDNRERYGKAHMKHASWQVLPWCPPSGSEEAGAICTQAWYPALNCPDMQPLSPP